VRLCLAARGPPRHAWCQSPFGPISLWKHWAQSLHCHRKEEIGRAAGEGAHKTKPSVSLLKGGIPAAPSGTATLLRLSPSHRFYPKQLLKRSPSSGTPGFHGLTGGVYKVRERIHRAMADARLLAIPTSWSRVADSNPNWDGLSWIGSTSRLSDPLYPPL
jgi:hypothetical protein